MGVFDKMQAEHKAAAKAREQQQSALQTFTAEFRKRADQFAKPCFQEFADEAVKAGHDARVADGTDEGGLPFVELRFTSHPDAKLGVGDRHQCVYRLRMTRDLKVEHIRQGDSHMEPFSPVTFGLGSISQEIIEQELAKLLKRALVSSGA